MAYIGLIHGAPSSVLDETLPPGYSLSRQQLKDIYALMLNVPITLEHKGIHRAFQKAFQETTDDYAAPTPSQVEGKLKASSSLDETIVGRVLEYFEVPDGGFYIIYAIDDKYPTVKWMIDNGKFTILLELELILFLGGSKGKLSPIRVIHALFISR